MWEIEIGGIPATACSEGALRRWRLDVGAWTLARRDGQA